MAAAGEIHVSERLKLGSGAADFEVRRFAPTLVANATRGLDASSRFHFANPSIDDPSTLAELEAVADLCQWRLCVVFEGSYGITIGQYWNALRLAKAARCLQNAVPIKLIVSQLGYDEPYFSRVFKAHYGVAPGAWSKIFRPNDRLRRGSAARVMSSP